METTQPESLHDRLLTASKEAYVHPELKIYLESHRLRLPEDDHLNYSRHAFDLGVGTAYIDVMCGIAADTLGINTSFDFIDALLKDFDTVCPIGTLPNGEDREALELQMISVVFLAANGFPQIKPGERESQLNAFIEYVKGYLYVIQTLEQ